MRNRSDITSHYLVNLLNKIEGHTTKYEEYRGSLWFHKDEHTPTILAKILAYREKIPAVTVDASPAQPETITATNDVAKLRLKSIIETHHDADHTYLSVYYEILQHLFICYKQSEHQDHDSIRALHDLLLTELKSQSEANWIEPDEDNKEETCISRALHTLSTHAEYDSHDEKLYAERWDIDDSKLLSLKKITKANGTDLKWDQMHHDQWWHIQHNDRYEINTAAKNILGLGEENHADCFNLHDKNSDIRRLEKELLELRHQKFLMEESNKKNQEKLRNKLDQHISKEKIEAQIQSLEKQLDTQNVDQKHQAAKIQRELDKLRIECDEYLSPIEIRKKIRELENDLKETTKDQDELIKDKTRELHTAYIQSMLDADTHPSGKNSLQRLHDLQIELSLWTSRNLSILLMDNLLDAQIHIMERIESTSQSSTKTMFDDMDQMDTKKTSLTTMIDSLGNELKFILQHVYATREKIKDELHQLQAIADAGLVDMHHLMPFHINDIEINPEEEAKAFKKYAEEHLLELTTAQHFKTAKALRTYNQTRGVVLPRVRDVLEYQPPAPPAAPTETPPNADAGPADSLRRSKRVLSGLAHLPETLASNQQDGNSDDDDDDEHDHRNKEGAPLLIQRDSHQPAQASRQPSASPIKNILFGIAVGVGLAILVAGITAAVIFANAVTLGGASLGFIFGGIFAAGIVGGFFGGALKSCCQPSTGHEPSSTSSAHIKTINADLHERLGNKTGRWNIPSSDATYQHVPQDITEEPLASPASRNQHTPFALTPSGSQH